MERATTADATRKVLLIHGIWMPALSMRWMAARLAQAGYEPALHAYAGAAGGPDAALPGLVARLGAGPTHVLAHSLGGLITLSTLAAHPELPVRRVVCLGSPLCGSAAAGGLARRAWTAAALGRSADLLLHGCPPWRGRAEVAVIAGSTPHGLGRYFGDLGPDSDGTVAVAETRLDGLTDHAVIAASHTGLLFSAEAAAMAAAYFRHGRLRA